MKPPRLDSLFVVSIDLGNSYCGFAYTACDNFINDGWSVQMNEPWSREKHQTYKTSSTLLLKPNGQSEDLLFGYEADREFQELYLDGLHKEHYLFKDFKKEFHKDGVSLETKIKVIYSEKTKLLFDVMLMAITYLKEKAFQLLEKRALQVTMADVFWVITVPAIWSEKTKTFYRDLVLESGISHRQLMMISEQEAALVYGLQYLSHRVLQEERLRIANIISMFGARTLVLDIGGDAATVTVHRVGGDKTLKTIFTSRSQGKGSNQVNEEFLLFLANIVGDDILKILRTDFVDDYQTLCNEFEMRKREIKSSTPDAEWFTFKFPVQLLDTFMQQHGTKYKTIHQRIQEKSDFAHRVKYELSRFSMEGGILKRLFNPTLDRIKVYINNVLQMKINHGTNAILLVGGFSQSEIVQAGIKQRFPEMEVIVPTDPELAVVKGAVISAFSPSMRPPTPVGGRYTWKSGDTVSFQSGISRKSIRDKMSALCTIV